MKITLSIITLLLLSTMSFSQYCDPTYINDYDWITNVTFNDINNNSTDDQDGYGGYGDFTDVSTTVDLGETYTLSVTFYSMFSDDLYVTAWFDWDGDDIFEDVYEIAREGNTTVTQDITIPVTAALGTTRMRIIERYDHPETDPCSSSGEYGEAEDYTIIIQSGAPCVVADPSNLASTSETGFSADLSWTENGTATQWDIEWNTTNSFSGTPTIENTSSNPYTLSELNASTTYYYRVRSDCGSSSESVWVGPFTFTTTVLYCFPSYSNTTSDWITNVTFNEINNTTEQEGANSHGYYTGQSTDVAHNSVYTLSVTFYTNGSSNYSYVTAWFDWNADGVFNDAGERYDIGSGSGASTTVTQEITIPVTATIGTTRMRIIEDYYDWADDPCNTVSSSYGETEDYTITITPIPMTYVSSEVTQNNISGTGVGSSDQEIICIKVETDGTFPTIDLTEFIINMNIGSGTSDITDITNIHIYYTGTNSTFAPTNEFVGGGTTPASGDITVNGSQALVLGMNYFWVTYDISDIAIINDYVDAQCSQITVDGSLQSPSTPSPAGGREIVAGCDHTITLYDYENTGWWTGSIDVLVDGVIILDNLTLASGDNGITYTFIAEQGVSIETVVNNGDDDMKYVISGFNGDFVLDNGNNKTTPIGKTGVASCAYEHKFTLNGDAYFNGDNLAKSSSSGDDITLTSDIRNQSASAWYNYKIDLSQDFEIDFTLNFGSNTGTSGADGITFVLQDECINCGGVGSSIGYGGIDPSVGIEFDTYDNGENNDMASDHTAIFKNGSNSHGTDELASSVSLAANIADGADHSVKVKWTVATKTLEMYWHTMLKLTYSGDIVNDIFSGDNQVYWGFTSGTGSATNLHKVKVTGYPNVSTTTQLQDVAIATGDTYQTEVQQGASYYWSSADGTNDGTIDFPTIYNPTFTPTVTTTYFCDIEDDCGNIVKDQFTISVGLLPIELLTFYGNCKEGVAELIWETASEINNDYFLLQSSSDAESWADVATIMGAGNSNSLISYQYTDNNPFNRTNYYRLKQVDYNGEFEYSETIILNCKSEFANIDLYPNPASGDLSFSFKTLNKCRLGIVMVNSLGQQVWQSSYDIEKGDSVISTDVSSLCEGMYLVKFVTTDGDIVQTNRLIISK